VAGVNSAGGAAHVFAVSLDQLADFASLVCGMGACVSDGTTQADIIADEFCAVGVCQEVINVGLADSETPVSVAPVMRFIAFGHCAALLRIDRRQCRKA